MVASEEKRAQPAEKETVHAGQLPRAMHCVGSFTQYKAALEIPSVNYRKMAIFSENGA